MIVYGRIWSSNKFDVKHLTELFSFDIFRQAVKSFWTCVDLIKFVWSNITFSLLRGRKDLHFAISWRHQKVKNNLFWSWLKCIRVYLNFGELKVRNIVIEIKEILHMIFCCWNTRSGTQKMPLKKKWKRKLTQCGRVFDGS